MLSLFQKFYNPLLKILASETKINFKVPKDEKKATKKIMIKSSGF